MSLPFTADVESDINTPTTNLCHRSIEHDHQWHELTIRGDDSILTLLKRICVYWNRTLFNKFRRILTFIFVAMLDVATRFARFAQKRRTPSSSPTPPPPAVTPPSIRTLEEELTASTASLLLDSTRKQQSNMKLAHMLVQQQPQPHRSTNIAIRRTSPHKDPLSYSRSVDDRYSLPKSDSTKLLNYLNRFTSEPHISIYHQSPQTKTSATTEYFNQTPAFFALSSSPPVPTSSSNEHQQDNDVNLNCDTNCAVTISSSIVANNVTSANSDKELDSLSCQTSTIDETLDRQESSSSASTTSQSTVDDDILLETNNSVPIVQTSSDSNLDRHFRRRKRRSSFTRNSFSLDSSDVPSTTTTETNVNDQKSKQELDDEHELVLLACFSPLQIDEPQTIVKNGPIEETEQTTESTANKEEEEEQQQQEPQEQPIAPLSRIRPRRLRHRLYRPTVTSSSQESTSNSNNKVDFFVPLDVFNNDSPVSPPPSPVSPLPSPVSPTQTTPPTIISSSSHTTVGAGGLKRIGSLGTTKKNVRFADSVGHELEHVQYIRSSLDDDANQSFLFGSSPSTSPLSHFKNNLYVLNSSHLEHKPWSFDVINTPKQPYEPPVPRRFFCLYRQPNSEHPDTYLHEVWKSQIKLEHADIRMKYYTTGEQHLVGTAWVTNISFWKYVCVRYTFDRWMNTYEREAKYRCNSNDYRNIDQFEFTIDIPSDVDRIDFILRYAVNGQEHWDNNYGNNYTLQTEAGQAPQTSISLPRDCDFNEMRFY